MHKGFKIMGFSCWQNLLIFSIFECLKKTVNFGRQSSHIFLSIFSFWQGSTFCDHKFGHKGLCKKSDVVCGDTIMNLSPVY